MTGEPIVHVNRDASHQLERGLRREWLVTNGRGDYASSTVLMCPTRRYHGLLVATPDGHARRHHFLARYEEKLHGVGRSFPLSIARYPGLWSPHGHDALVGFDLASHPVFRYRLGGTLVTRQILLVTGRAVSLCRYEAEGLETELTLELRPLLGFRQADALTVENLHLSPRVDRPGLLAVRVQPYRELPPLLLVARPEEGVFETDPIWYRQLEYTRDLERGYDGHEDQFSPGRFLLPLREGQAVVVAASIDGPVEDPIALWAAESARRKTTVAGHRGLSPTRARLAAAADDFLYRTRDGRLGVVAGFPWFDEWGRDTFISTPGLTLSRGLLAECGEILEGALPYLRHGLMPNVFGPAPDASAYNSADAALWFAWAVRQYDRAGAPERQLLHTFLPALEQIAIHYRDGTALGIVVDDGLVRAGTPDTNVTWMDAMTPAGPVTPRNGCAVEINALWISLLGHLTELQRRTGDAWRSDAWRAHLSRAEDAFRQHFWLPDQRYLADVVQDARVDTRIRPNMLWAAALEDGPLSTTQRVDVVRVAEAELLTPRGLRTLSPEDPAYKGRFDGGPVERDQAYHQGTVWPWLLGAYVEATLRAYGPDPDRARSLRALLDGLGAHLETAGLGHVSEVFDGDPPHRPGGTVAQAWNVAELLRAYALLDEVDR